MLHSVDLRQNWGHNRTEGITRQNLADSRRLQIINQSSVAIHPAIDLRLELFFKDSVQKQRPVGLDSVLFSALLRDDQSEIGHGRVVDGLNEVRIQGTRTYVIRPLCLFVQVKGVKIIVEFTVKASKHDQTTRDEHSTGAPAWLRQPLFES